MYLAYHSSIHKKEGLLWINQFEGHDRELNVGVLKPLIRLDCQYSWDWFLSLPCFPMIKIVQTSTTHLVVPGDFSRKEYCILILSIKTKDFCCDFRSRVSSFCLLCGRHQGQILPFFLLDLFFFFFLPVGDISFCAIEVLMSIIWIWTFVIVVGMHARRRTYWTISMTQLVLWY